MFWNYKERLGCLCPGPHSFCDHFSKLAAFQQIGRIQGRTAANFLGCYFVQIIFYKINTFLREGAKYIC